MPVGAQNASTRSSCPAAGVAVSWSRVTRQIRAMVRCASPPSAVWAYMPAGWAASSRRYSAGVVPVSAM